MIESIMLFFKDYKDHIEEISNKLVTIMENMIEAQLTKVRLIRSIDFHVVTLKKINHHHHNHHHPLE